MTSFMTGSRVYGTPRPDSDVDVVVLVSLDDATDLWAESQSENSVRYGHLNLILCTDTEKGREKFKVWKEVTEYLKSQKPVTREKAVREFQKRGIGVGEDVGSGPKN